MEKIFFISRETLLENPKFQNGASSRESAENRRILHKNTKQISRIFFLVQEKF